MAVLRLPLQVELDWGYVRLKGFLQPKPLSNVTRPCCLDQSAFAATNSSQVYTIVLYHLMGLLLVMAMFQTSYVEQNDPQRDLYRRSSQENPSQQHQSRKPLEYVPQGEYASGISLQSEQHAYIL